MSLLFIQQYIVAKTSEREGVLQIVVIDSL